MKLKKVLGWGAGANRAVARKPVNLSFEQAASLPIAAITALQGLRDKGKVQPGQNVLINGASGGVGTFAVQIAMAFGASVTGVCSTRNVDLVRSLGADHVVDYTGEDFTDTDERYDAELKAEDLAVLRELIETGKVTPVIDRRYALSEVPDAIRYVETGRARGKVVITVE